MFGLLSLAIQRSISPLSSLLTPCLPFSVIITSSSPSVIYQRVMEVWSRLQVVRDDEEERGQGASGVDA